jgi:phosphoglycerol transferase MdoB-like AlkP superfamily enzyme
MNESTTVSKLAQATWSSFKTSKWWAIPLSFLLTATGFAFAHAYLAWGSYVSSGALRWSIVPPLFGALYAEFAICGVIVSLLYRRGWTRAVTWLLLGLLCLVNCAQLVANVYSSEFISSAVVRLAPLIGQVVSAGSIAMLTLGMFASLSLLIGGLQFARLDSAKIAPRSLAAVVTAAWGIALGLSVRAPQVSDVRAHYGLRPDAPMLSLARAISESFSDNEASRAPSDEQIAAAKQAGISIAPKSGTPFRKDWIYRKALPFAKRAGASAKPNVIVFFLESLSAEVLGPYNPQLRGVTPHFDDFAPHAMRVDDYVNHTIPTVTGLRGQLCSMFPGFSYSPWRAAEKPHVGRVLCLPKLLRDFGYDAIYLNHGAAGETHFDAQTIDWGFQRAYFDHGVLDDLLKGETAENGSQASDQQMMRATIEFLERRRKQAGAKPLFLAVSTIETHTGHRTKLKFGNGRNRVLNSFHNLDDAFGLFWTWYQNSEWTKDTILVVTGDHVLYPQDDLRKVATPRHLNSTFGYLGLFIMDPTHELPASYAVRASSVDFAPTMIQLLGLPAKQPNPFMGLSMFSDRQATSLALGMNYGKQLLVWDRAQDAPEIYPTRPEDGRPRALFDVLRYAQAIEHENRLWLH